MVNWQETAELKNCNIKNPCHLSRLLSSSAIHRKQQVTGFEPLHHIFTNISRWHFFKHGLVHQAKLHDNWWHCRKISMSNIQIKSTGHRSCLNHSQLETVCKQYLETVSACKRFVVRLLSTSWVPSSDL